MRARTVQTWSARRIGVRRRLERVCTSSRLFLMVVTTKHALDKAARFSGRHTSPCSKMVKALSHVAVSTLESLSQTPAKHVATARHKWKELPWKSALVVDSTLQQRARRPPAHAQTFHHGPGCVVGHQGTQSVLLRNAMRIPLRPLPCSRQRSGREHARASRPEHALVVDDIQQLNLADSIGAYEPREVVV